MVTGVAARTAAASARATAARRTRRGFMGKLFGLLFQPRDGGVLCGGGEALVVVRLLQREAVARGLERVDLTRALDGGMHVGGGGVAIHRRLHDEHRPRRDRGDEFVV